MKLEINTKGNYEIIDITDKVNENIKEGKIANIFVTGTTASLRIIEYEEGHVNDLKRFFKDLDKKEYLHDDSGHVHLLGAIFGQSLTIPVENGKLNLGRWQRVVLIDFDNRARKREVILEVM